MGLLINKYEDSKHIIYEVKRKTIITYLLILIIIFFGLGFLRGTGFIQGNNFWYYTLILALIILVPYIIECYPLYKILLFKSNKIKIESKSFLSKTYKIKK